MSDRKKGIFYIWLLIAFAVFAVVELVITGWIVNESDTREMLKHDWLILSPCAILAAVNLAATIIVGAVKQHRQSCYSLNPLSKTKDCEKAPRHRRLAYRLMLLKSRIATDQEQMLPLSFFGAYILTPVYLLLCLLFIFLLTSMITADEQRFTTAVLVCIGMMGALSAGMLIYSAVVKKKVLSTESKRYDFNTATIEEKDKWSFRSTDGAQAVFRPYGVIVNGEWFYYRHILTEVKTSNRFGRVNLHLALSSNDALLALIPLSAEVLKMLGCFAIKLENRYILDRIRSDQEQAFTEIYTTGTIRPPKKRAAIAPCTREYG